MAVEGIGFSFMGIIVLLFIGAIGLGIFGVVIYAIVSSTKQKVKNDHSPRVTSSAKIVNKRQKVRGEQSRTFYYATFEFDSGDRMEFSVEGEESGMLVEGDIGQLTFQGTRFIGFDRSRS